MKFIKYSFLMAIVALSLSSCGKSILCRNGDGNQVTETRAVGSFSKVSLDLSANAYLKQGNSFTVQVTASKNVQNLIETEIEGGTLVIREKKHRCVDDNITIYISVPSLQRVSVSGSGNVYASGLIQSNSLQIDISGSGRVEMDSLDVIDLQTIISGSGRVQLQGIDTVATQNTTISGSGRVETHLVPSSQTSVNISGSGNCTANAINTLNVNISGSGSLRYTGTPVVSTNISGSGTVSPY